MNYLDKAKRLLFPNIKDWKDPQDKIKAKDWWKMGNIEWLIFHPLSYKYTTSGVCFGSFISFGFFSWFFYNRSNMIFSTIFGLISLRMAWASWKKIKSWKTLNISTFYDLLFREY